MTFQARHWIVDAYRYVVGRRKHNVAVTVANRQRAEYVALSSCQS